MGSGYVQDNDKIKMVEKYAKEFGFTKITCSPGSTTFIRMNEENNEGFNPYSILTYSHGLDYVKFSTGKNVEKFKIGDLSLGILESTCVHRIKNDKV